MAPNRLASCVAPSSSFARGARGGRRFVDVPAQATAQATAQAKEDLSANNETGSFAIIPYRRHRFAEKETRSHYQPGTVRLRLIDNRGGGGMIIDRATAAALELLRNVM